MSKRQPGQMVHSNMARLDSADLQGLKGSMININKLTKNKMEKTRSIFLNNSKASLVLAVLKKETREARDNNRLKEKI